MSTRGIRWVAVIGSARAAQEKASASRTSSPRGADLRGKLAPRRRIVQLARDTTSRRPRRAAGVQICTVDRVCQAVARAEPRTAMAWNTIVAPGVTSDDFDLQALHAALDAERQARGLTWAEASRDIGAVGSRPAIHPIASSTIAGLRTKVLAEADGVLQMLRWLGRAPESFMTGVPASLAAASLPEAARSEVLRVDTRKLHGA